MENHHHHHHAETDSSGLAELLDLDAEVLHEQLTELIDRVHGQAGDLSGGRILDLGAGTGAGAIALAQRFTGAEVTAVDVSAAMLDHLARRADDLGLADRIHPVRADLDAPWPALGPVDLVWASASMHHMADPDRALAEAFAVLRPGGLLAVVEIDSFPRFLPDDIGIGRPGLEGRCHAVVDRLRAVDMPHLGDDWGSRLGKAGFAIEVERAVAIELTPPLPAATGRYALASLRRVRSGLDGRLDADDLATLDTLISSDGPEGLLRRDDLGVRAGRSFWLARRP
jgi:SAM-dependent methyltransferase